MILPRSSAKGVDSKQPQRNAEAELRRLLDIMAALRDPDRGCPWDKEQTFDTIAPYTIEEAYEVADAIARADFAGLPDELGDLLLQVVYHARMAEEAGRFDFADVAGPSPTRWCAATRTCSATPPSATPPSRPPPGRRTRGPRAPPGRRPARWLVFRPASLP